MRIAVVVQRYGPEVAGGAELHARYVAEMLARDHEVTVLTTTALDYVTWAPHYAAGETTVAGIRVIRFEVARPRVAERFAVAADRAFSGTGDPAHERAYLEEQGPWAPALWEHVAGAEARYDAIVAVSFRYATTLYAALARPALTILVPTAEDDPAVRLALSRELFRAVRTFAFNTPEERALLEAAAGGPLPGEVVGIGSRVPTATDSDRFREKHGITRPYVLYVGRIDRNKGCADVVEFFASFIAETGLPHELLLVGRAVIDLPPHSRIRHLGFLDDGDKFDAIAGAEVLLLPSAYESLSMVVLEAMALGIPPLVNGRCDVLRGQMLRSNAGLWYQGYDVFFEALRLLVGNPRLRNELGKNGQAFYHDSYAPAVIAEKYARLLAAVGGR